jgi:hypothetical protein
VVENDLAFIITCSERTCVEDVYSMNLCAKHYQRQRRLLKSLTIEELECAANTTGPWFEQYGE